MFKSFAPYTTSLNAQFSFAGLFSPLEFSTAKSRIIESEAPLFDEPLHPLLTAPVPSFEVYTLANGGGAQGFEIIGIDAGGYSGIALANAGDVNGDGFDDVLIGASYASVNGSASGRSFLVFGTATSYGGSLDLVNLDGTNGFAINGAAASDSSGEGVAGIGDFNNDGYDDIIIGSYGADINGTDSGASYVIFGSASGHSGSLELSSLNGANGFRLSGLSAGDNSGRSVSGLGDVNGDGYDDFLIGSWGANGTGVSYVVFGRDTSTTPFTADFDLTTLTGANGFAINGVAASDAAGWDVSDAGDVNGDGYDDILIGAYAADPAGSASGTSYVVFGTNTGFSSSFDLSTLNGTNGFAMTGVGTTAFSGFAVSGAGDVNGDGFDDVIVGAYRMSPGGVPAAGQSYVVFGAASGQPASLDLTTLNGTNGFSIDGFYGYSVSGYAVSSAGDVNGDGFDDILVGAKGYVPNGNIGDGAAYLIYGSASGHGGSLNLNTIDGVNGFAIHGFAFNHQLGYEVSGGGDVNNDGYDDILVSAVGYDVGASADVGASYVIYGTPNLERATINLTSGNDTYTASAASLQVYGLEGDDQITGTGGDDVIYGGVGDDSIRPWAGADYIDGGAGSDWVNYWNNVGAGAIIVDLATGLVSGGFAEGDFLVSIENVNGSPYADIIMGNEDANIINGNGDNDVLYGFGGDDILNGNNHADTLIGGAGADMLDGGIGNDTAVYLDSNAAVIIDLTLATGLGGHAEGDTFVSIENIQGSAFNDNLIGHTGAGNHLYGNDGNDRLEGVGSINILEGGAGADLFVGGSGTDTFIGGIGIDTVSYAAGALTGVVLNMDTGGTSGMAAGDTYIDIEKVIGTHFNDTITGSSGNDFLYGLGGNDTINGGDGIDRIYGGDGDDIQRGDAGSDTLYGSAGADQLNGGVGVDVVRYSEAESLVVVDMATGGTVGDADGDTYFGIEAIYGSDYNDTITGNSSGNELRGGDGDDTLNGAGGNDRLFGEAGADALDGGAGIDRAHYTTAVTLDLTTGGTAGDAAGDTYTSIEWVVGSDFADDITGDALANSLFGNDGADILSGAAGNDRLYGGNGDDTINGGDGIDFIYGQAGNDSLFGNDGNDFFYGSAGADAMDGGADFDTVSYLPAGEAIIVNMQTGGTGGDATGDTYTNIERLFGSNFGDTITGSDGADTIVGLGGADLIDGGLGNDRLFGGAGDDGFVYDTTNGGADQIYFYRGGSLGNEIIHIQGGDPDFDTFAEIMAVASEVGNNVVFDFGSGNTITLINLNLGFIDSNDFDFNVPLAETPTEDKALTSLEDLPTTHQDTTAQAFAEMPDLTEALPDVDTDAEGTMDMDVAEFG